MKYTYIVIDIAKPSPKDKRMGVAEPVTRKVQACSPQAAARTSNR